MAECSTVRAQFKPAKRINYLESLPADSILLPLKMDFATVPGTRLPGKLHDFPAELKGRSPVCETSAFGPDPPLSPTGHHGSFRGKADQICSP